MVVAQRKRSFIYNAPAFFSFLRRNFYHMLKWNQKSVCGDIFYITLDVETVNINNLK